MASWQEVVQTAATHMENTNLTMYLVHQEDARRVRKEYMAAVIKACEERDAAHAKETEAWNRQSRPVTPKIQSCVCWRSHIRRRVPKP